MSKIETTDPNEPAPPRTLTPEAQRALAEAEARRQASLPVSGNDTPGGKEIGGRDGPDPVRFGDWETGGIATDF